MIPKINGYSRDQISIRHKASTAIHALITGVSIPKLRRDI